MKFTKDTSQANCTAYSSVCGRFQIRKDSDNDNYENAKGWSLWEDGERIADAKTKRELVIMAEQS